MHNGGHRLHTSTDKEKAEIVREMVGKVILTNEGNKKIITLLNKDNRQYLNTYIYERRGSKAFLSVNNGKETKPIDTKNFVVKRFERQKYCAESV